MVHFIAYCVFIIAYAIFCVNANTGLNRAQLVLGIKKESPLQTGQVFPGNSICSFTRRAAVVAVVAQHSD